MGRRKVIPYPTPHGANGAKIAIQSSDIRRMNTLIDFILCFEEEDFQENPSLDHPYFVAYSLRYGHDEAVIEYLSTNPNNQEK